MVCELILYAKNYHVESVGIRRIASVARIKRSGIREPDSAKAPDSVPVYPGYRLRVGDYRIIYTVDNGALIITIIKIGSRGDVYE